jgi:hypothetical protein
MEIPMNEGKQPSAPSITELFLAELARAAEIAAIFRSPPRIGPGRRTIFTLHKKIERSHAGKPADYIKPYGTRPKGYPPLCCPHGDTFVPRTRKAMF